jgi:tRNA threonylcarbamoyladenosine biosynthesis protein TsaB
MNKKAEIFFFPTTKTMKLYIDTSNSEKVVIKLDEKKFETKAREKKSQKLLPFIVETFKKEGKKFEDIKEIEVNTGPGSFTGLRVGVSVANALGWQLKIPVNGKNLQKGEMVDIKY